MPEWIDLVDPTEQELEAAAPRELHPRALDQLLAPAEHADEPRPTLEAHEGYVFGVLLVAVSVPEEDRVYYQEVDLVLTRETLLTVSKTPQGEQPFDPRTRLVVVDVGGAQEVERGRVHAPRQM